MCLVMKSGVNVSRRAMTDNWIAIEDELPDEFGAYHIKTGEHESVGAYSPMSKMWLTKDGIQLFPDCWLKQPQPPESEEL